MDRHEVLRLQERATGHLHAHAAVAVLLMSGALGGAAAALWKQTTTQVFGVILVVLLFGALQGAAAVSIHAARVQLRQRGLDWREML